MRMKSTAVKDGDHWVINGAKNFITHGNSGDAIVVIVRTGELLDSELDISILVVENLEKPLNFVSESSPLLEVS